MGQQHQRGGEPQHYDELGVSPTATVAQIRTAYVALARRHHPDRMNSADASARAESAARMARVNAAWTVLSDPAKRAAYDARHAIAPTGAASNVRDPDTSFSPFDDGDDIDPRLLDDTPTGAPTIPRVLAFVPTGLAVVGVGFVLFGALLGLGGLLIGGFAVLATSGLSFLALPFIALISASRSDRE